MEMYTVTDEVEEEEAGEGLLLEGEEVLEGLGMVVSKS